LGVDIKRYHPQSDKWGAQQYLLGQVMNPVIYDVGANVGQTLQEYKAIFPDSRVFSFEPFPESFHMLEQVADNFENSRVFPLAMAEHEGERDFYINTHFHATNSLLPRPASGQRYYPEEAVLEDKITVKVDTIDHFSQQENIEQIDVLKMDIQGGELAALHGAKLVLETQSVKLVVTEVMFVPHYEGGALFDEIHDFLKKCGYSLYGMYEQTFAENGQLRFADAIFINQKMRDSLAR